MNPTFLQNPEFEQRTTATLGWLKRSIEVTNFNGSAAFYSRWRKPFSGWEKGYPETTGYIIETLLDYATLDSRLFKSACYLELSDYALRCVDWLCKIQNPEGYYPALLGDKNIPSVFNSSQILFGLIRAYQFSKNDKYLIASEKIVAWLIANLEENGSWKIGAYQENFIPSYYTRSVWAVLFANQILQKKGVNEKMKKALDYYFQKINTNGSIQNWGFSSDEMAFTHTIAYTLRGFLEAGILLKTDKYLDRILNTCDYLFSELEIPGSYNNGWKGDYSFKCVTGNAQLSILFCKLFQLKKEKKYYEKAISIFEEIKNAPNNSNSKNRHGAIPGSIPFYGKYMCLKYPNWAAKFYLDAILILKTTQKDILD